MIILLIFLTFIFVTGFIFFGISFLLLRDSIFKKLFLELSFLFCPVSIIVFSSFFGYLRAERFSLAVIFIIFLLNLMLSIYVIIEYFKEIKLIIIENYKRIVVVIFLSFLSGVVLIPYHIKENDFGYFEFMNGENLNYSQFSIYSMKMQKSNLPDEFVKKHQAGREGIVFLNSTVSFLLRKHPIHIVQFCTALLRFIYCTIIFTIIFNLFEKKRRGFIFSFIICSGFVFYNLDISLFFASFMASYAALPIFISMILLIHLFKEFKIWQFLVFYIIGNISLLITYPEIMPLLKVFEIFNFFIYIFKKERNNTKLLCIGNVLVFIINPILVVKKVFFVSEQLLIGNPGWNFMGESLVLFKRLLGMEFNYISLSSTVSQNFIKPIFIFYVILVLIGLYYSSKYMKDNSFILIPIFLLYFILTPIISGSYNFYNLVKYIFLCLWLLPLIFSVLLIELKNRVIFRFFFISFFSVFIVMNLITYGLAVKRMISLPSFYSSRDAQSVSKQIKCNKKISVLSNKAIPLLYWFQVLDSEGFEIIYLNKRQAELYSRGSFDKLNSKIFKKVKSLNENKLSIIMPFYSLSLKENSNIVIEKESINSIDMFDNLRIIKKGPIKKFNNFEIFEGEIFEKDNEKIN